ALTFFVGVGVGFFVAVDRGIEGNCRSHVLDEKWPVKPQDGVLVATTSAITPCLWTEIEDLAEEKEAAEFSKRVVVTSSHGTSEGTSFLVIGNSNLDKLR
ncbi:MAG: hypothetical protein SGILL_005129, partial [Bacillariaceae sp.]